MMSFLSEKLAEHKVGKLFEGNVRKMTGFRPCQNNYNTTIITDMKLAV